MKKLEKLVLIFFHLTSCKLMVYVILNREKVENSANPPLSVLGQEIAEVLKIELANIGITEVYSANYM